MMEELQQKYRLGADTSKTVGGLNLDYECRTHVLNFDTVPATFNCSVRVSVRNMTLFTYKRNDKGSKALPCGNTMKLRKVISILCHSRQRIAV